MDPSGYAVLYTTRGETSIKITWGKTTEIKVKDREVILFLACFSDYLDNDSIDFLKNQLISSNIGVCTELAYVPLQ